ncbi:DUF4183 domain-containing protein [Paenibacillus vietnamensis]|uniref:DUF4183 domain-containing protein n=1 Tax=Paenibacillus vietnamensis TaxID=2590547 RepID=UPI001CD0CC75|nr:DUF4183 domain-containing protein [Paenibacillus vietnamensis]
MQGPAGPPIQEILVEPVARRYFYFAEEDLVTEVNIPASQFVDDNGASQGMFFGTGINGFAHIFINGMLQEGRMYRVSQGALTLFLSEGDVIFAGTPIIVETVEYFVQFIQNQPT